MLSIRDPFQIYGHRLKVKVWKVSFLCKYKSKETWSRNIPVDFNIKTIIGEK